MKRIVLFAAALGLALALVPSAALAHDDNANLTDESDPSSAAGPLTYDLQVGATYSIDGDLVESATMTVTGTGPDGATLASTPLAAVPESVGLYGAELTFPAGGTWSLTVTSTEPAGELQLQVDVPAEEATPTSEAVEPTPTTEEPVSDEGVEEEAEEDDDLLPILVGIVVVVLAVGTVVALVLRRRQARGEPLTD